MPSQYGKKIFYCAESTRNEIFIILSQCGICFHYTESMQNEIFIMLCQHRMKFSLCLVNTRLDFLYAESTRNEIFIMPSQHKMRFSLCWVNAKWDFHYVSQQGMRFSLRWVNTEWDFHYAESARNDIFNFAKSNAVIKFPHDESKQNTWEQLVWKTAFVKKIN